MSKYPKLWNGTNAVGEAKVRQLQKIDVPFLSAQGPGFESNTMGRFSEVFGGQETRYRGLAYAGSSVETSSPAYRWYTFPYAGTSGDYGTPVSAAWSAASTPQGDPPAPVRATVARLVAKDALGTYRDELRGIDEGSRISPTAPQRYWVREHRVVAALDTYPDTDEVWTTAGGMVMSNNKVIAAFLPNFNLMAGSTAFPFANAVVVISPTGLVVLLRKATDPVLIGPGLPSRPQDIGVPGTPIWHIEPLVSSTVVSDPFVPWDAPTFVQTAVSQKGGRFAIFSGGGWAKEYALAKNPTSGDIEYSVLQSVADAFGAESFSWSATVGSTGPGATGVDTSSWLPGETLQRLAVPSGGGADIMADYAVLGSLSSDSYEYSKTWDLSGTQSATQTVAIAYVNGTAVNVTLTRAKARTGTISASETLLWAAHGGHTYNAPPAGYSWKTPLPRVDESATLSIPAVSPLGVVVGGVDPAEFWASNAVISGEANGYSYAAERTATGCGYTHTDTLEWGSDSLVVRDESVTFSLSVSMQASRAWVMQKGTDLNGDSYFSALDGLSESASSVESMTSTRTLTTRDVLLLDAHNAVLVYIEKSLTATATHAGASFDYLYGADSPLQTTPVEVSQSSTASAKIVVQFNSTTYEKSFDPSITDLMIGADMESGRTLLNTQTLSLGTTLLTLPTMQGECRHIAYRNLRHDTLAKRELIFAYDEPIVYGAVTVQPQFYLTESGVEDWLTTCGLPASVGRRIANCFRVGGPGPQIAGY